MRDIITSIWQDYESHLFTCSKCQTKTLGQDLVQDYASEYLLPLDCPKCESRVTVLRIDASIEEIQTYAAQGYKTAIDHLQTANRHYESWPDFTVGDDEDDAASRIANSIELLADPSLGQDAVQFMTMAAWGIKNATEETPYIVESPLDESNYFQVIRGIEGEYYSELGSPDAAGKPANEMQRAELELLGWIMPNDVSPNYHREYEADADRYAIAADAARGWFSAYKF
jgi:transcription elongation factor Elf1